MFKPVDASRIGDAVEKVLNSEDTLNCECISLFEILSIYQEIKQNTENLKDKIESRITEKVKAINDKYYIVMHDFDYEKRMFCISIVDSLNETEVEIYFCKDNNIISIFATEGSVNHEFDDILSLIGVEVETWYDYCYKLREIYTQYSTNVKSQEAEFFLNISSTCVCIYFDKNQITSCFKLLSFYEADIIYCKCKFDDVLEIIKGRKVEFMKKIFVRISACPMWIREHLVMERHEQICEIKRRIKEAQDKQRKIEKKQKRREKLKKVFPFIKT